MRLLLSSVVLLSFACTARIPPKPSCGDALLHTGEECDDGNDVPNDGCENDCTITVCGNGLVDPGEECDDGDNNANVADACRLNCLLPACGDAILDSSEQCEDGNNIDADGCEADCSLPACENGIIDPGELCFADPITLAVPNQPRGIDIADINADGLVDIVVSEQGLSVPVGGFGDGIDDQVVVLFQQANNTFAAPVGIIVADQSRFVRAKDVNGDGLPEVFVTHQNEGQFTRLANTAGVLSVDSLVAIPGAVELAIGDIDQDQLDDFVVASSSGAVTVILSSQASSFLLQANGPVEGVDLGDINDDGTLDILVVCGFATTLVDQLMIFSGEDVIELQSNAAPTDELSVGTTRAARIGDFDGDNLVDIAAVDRSTDEVVFFLQQNNGNFSERREPVGFELISLAVADINNDGKDDILTAEEGDNQSTLLVHEGGQNFLSFVFPVGDGPRVVATGDLNQDGLIDFATTDLDGDTVTVYLSAP